MNKYVPSCGDYLCLAKRCSEYKVPYRVIDIQKDKIAIQQCLIIDKENRKIQDDPNGQIVILTWDKKLNAWVWKFSYKDSDPMIATFYPVL